MHHLVEDRPAKEVANKERQTKCPRCGVWSAEDRCPQCRAHRISAETHTEANTESQDSR